jgi:hypothetical protein
MELKINKGQVTKLLLVVTMLFASNGLIACQSRSQKELPRAIAEVLAIEPFDSSFPERFIVHARRDAFGASETEITKENMQSCWKALGVGLEICTHKQWSAAHGSDFDNKVSPAEREYIEFVIRNSKSKDIARALVTVGNFHYGVTNGYYELTMKWTGTKWEKESIKKHAYPMPTD